MSLFARTARVGLQRQVRRFADMKDAPKVNFFPAETWPLLVCIAGGVTLSVYIQARYVFSSPDIRWSKSARLDPVNDDHISAYGERFGTHQHGIASKTGNNVFFAGAKIPTRNECDDSKAKTVSLAGIFAAEE